MVERAAIDGALGTTTRQGVAPESTSAAQSAIPYDAAEDYRAVGWTGTLPLPLGKKSPPPKGFTGYDGAWPTPDDITKWRENGYDSTRRIGNIALRFPPVVAGLDVDHYGDKIGGKTLAEREAEWGPLPATWTTTSRSDGVSGIRVYRVPSGVSAGMPTGIKPDIEIIRHAHRYAVVWPSIHPDTGQPYRWFDPDGKPSDRIPSMSDLAELPVAWIVGLTGQGTDGSGVRHGSRAAARQSGQKHREWINALPKGKPCRYVGKLADELLAAARREEGAAYDACRDVTLALVRAGEQGHRGIPSILATGRKAYVATVGPDRPGGAGVAEAEFNRFTLGAVGVVLAEPSLAVSEQCNCPEPVELEAAESWDGATTLVLQRDAEADLSNARSMAIEFGDVLRYVVTWKQWLIWDGRRWKPDTTGAVWRYAKLVADQIPRKTTRDGRPARLQTAAGLAAMIKLASTEPIIAIDHEDLDADPFLLNLANGTYDLRTDKLRDFDKADLITKITNAAYRPEATSKVFAGFLARIQPDKEMRDFLGRLLGHALEGRQVVHILPIFCGSGANGKGTLIGAVEFALGDYAAPGDPELLMAHKFEMHPTGVADLYGLRLVTMEETDRDRNLAEGTAKRLTGGSRTKARRMQENFWWFTPTHTFVMLTNYRPKIRGTDPAIWRRLKLVPFSVEIPLAEQDVNLGEELKLAADAVLGWLIDGYRDWKSRGGGPAGLADPAEVSAATAKFRNEEDLLGRFLDERCVTAGSAKVRSAVLFAAYEKWCVGEHIPAADIGTQTSFSLDLIKRGFDKKRGNAGLVWHGIDLRADDEAGDDEADQSADPFE